MSHPIFPRPLDPAVQKNQFRGRRYQKTPIPSLAEARARLPEPLLDDRPQWLEMYWRAWEMAWSHLRRPRPASGFVANFIDTAFNDNTFMWDSVFMVQFGLYGRRAFDFMGTLDNFYARQHDDGYICREINTYEGYDFFHPFDPNGTGPNVMAWGEWRYYRLTGDDSRLAPAFWPLLGYHRWCQAHRTWPSGLAWATGLSSGMDNQTRVPDSGLYHHHWTWVDASLQAALSCRMLEHIALYIGEDGLAESLAADRAFLIREINGRLWDESAGFYKDLAPDGRFSPVKSIGAYWALLVDDLLSTDRQTALIRHLREPDAFKRPHRVPSQSADSPGYEPETGDYWRGGVWSPTNFMLLKGLRRIGQHALAHEIAVNHLENVWTVFERTNTFWENYAPESAAPGQPAKPDFVGWSGLTPIAILLEDVIGLHVDWPQRRVLWDRRLPGQYGVRNYPLGSDGTLTVLGDETKVTVTTSHPFSLVVSTPEGQSQTVVQAGTSELELAR